MFTAKQNTSSREIGAAHSALTQLLATRDDWFDGTPASVDRRIAAVTNALPLVQRVANTDLAMLEQSERLRIQLSALHDMKRDLLTSERLPHRTLPKVSAIGKLTQRGREFIASELEPFLAENVDVLDDRDELDTRAENHAEIKTLQMPVTEAKAVVAHFRLAVDWSARNAHRQAARTQPAQRVASLDDVPDEALFD